MHRRVPSLPSIDGRRSRNALRLMGAIAAIAALVGAGCSPGGQAAEEEATAEVPRNVRALELVPTELNEYLTISGPLSPLRGTVISAEEGGRVVAITSDKGAPVAAGATMVQLDHDLLTAERDAAAAQRDLRAFNEERTRKLFEANSVSRIEMLQAETELRSAAAAARIAQIRLDRTAISAPYDGVITDRYVELGQLVAPGIPVVRIVDPYVLILEGDLTEREVGFLTVGERALITCDGVARELEAQVHWVGLEADPQTGKFPIEIRVENPDLNVHPGVIACARVLKARHADVITIPRDAVVQRGAGPVAYVVEGEVARERMLELGPDQGLMVVVTDGLQAGDRLVVRGQRDVHDGAKVIVQEEATAADGSLPADPGVVTQTWTTPQEQSP